MTLSDRASFGLSSSSTSCFVIALAAAFVASGCVGAITGGGPEDSGEDPGDHRGGEGGGGGGDGEDGDGPSGGGGGEGDDLNPEVQSEGSVAVTLHPGPAARIGSPTLVSFGAPFPRGALADVGQLRARGAGGEEIPIHADAILPWRAWPGRSDATESVRAAMVSVEVTFAAREPMQIELEYGAAPARQLAAPANPRADWVDVVDGEYPEGTTSEPPVYASFPAGWLSECVLRTRTLPVGSDETYAWLDEAVVGFAETAVNDVPDSVTDLIDYVDDASAWLFDRTSNLFGVYVRTGDVRWLRRAHRSARYYLGLIDSDGYFTFERGDLKYSYGRALLLDFIFTGDPALVDAIERIASAGAEWDPTYDLDTNFWTERHQTYALLASLAAWEATGRRAHADRTGEIARVSFALASDPDQSFPDDGCMLHGMTAHEGSGGDTPVCSPWMSALFADAVWEYYIHAADGAALDFLASLGRFVADHGLYSDADGFTVPWYLASSETQVSEGADIEHTCDVGGLVARGAWAERARGGDPTRLRAVAAELVEACEFNLDSWHRPNGPSSGLSEWRLSPERKFNWWFGTTSDLSWLLSSLDE